MPEVLFNLIATVVPIPPATSPLTTYQDNVACNAGGFSYFVTAVVLNPTEQESVPSNTAPPSGTLLTGCYTNTPPTPNVLNDLSFPANTTFVQGDSVSITWTLQVDNINDYAANSYVIGLAVNTLVAIGPVSNDASCGSVSNGRTPCCLQEWYRAARAHLVPAWIPIIQTSSRLGSTGTRRHSARGVISSSWILLKGAVNLTANQKRLRLPCSSRLT